MSFRRLAFQNFRNLADRELSLGSRQVLLVGENGQGKTNLLEAVYLLCVASSFRERREEVLLRDSALPAALFGSYREEGSMERTSAVGWQQPGCRKEVRLDGRLVADRAALLSEFLCVCFVQEDMEIVAGPPEARRRFFDQTLALADVGWLAALRSYRQVLRSRNLALKARTVDLLDVYDVQAAPLGLEIMRRRHEATAEFDAVFAPLMREITGGSLELSIRYRPSWAGLETGEQVTARLAADRGRDIALGSTTTGPHRDHFAYLAGGREFSRYASTGQRRLCALVLRVAMARFLAARTGRRPVLLLDDVLLELDPARKRAFVESFPEYEQAFFTFLPDENWLSYRGSDAQVLTVEHGEFST